jgi:hypothetical protein
MAVQKAVAADVPCHCTGPVGAAGKWTVLTMLSWAPPTAHGRLLEAKCVEAAPPQMSAL